jgi:hypothetical protein
MPYPKAKFRPFSDLTMTAASPNMARLVRRVADLATRLGDFATHRHE